MRIYLAADYQYWYNHADYVAKMTARINDINARFESQTDVSFSVTNFYPIPSNYCTSTNATILLGQFKDYLINTLHVPANQRDLAHLFSGKTLVGFNSFYQAGAGEDRWYNNYAAYDGYECSVSQQSIYGDNNLNDWILGYDIAHSLTGDSAYATTISPGHHSWLWQWWAQGIDLTFSTNNANRIRAWAAAIADKEKYINYGISSRTADGIEASCIFQTNDYVCMVGQPASVTFTLTNYATVQRTLTSVYVDGRNPGNNYIWSYFVELGSYPLAANGGSATWTFPYTPDVGGLWNLWPNYNYSGHQGFPGGSGAVSIHPISWYNITSNYRYWQGHASSAYSTDLFYRWGLFTDTYNMTLGGLVLAYAVIFNMNVGTGTNTYMSAFIQGRGINGESDTKDFGIISNPVLTQKANSYVGGGSFIYATRSLTDVGKYKFFPSFRTSSGQWGPGDWQGKRLAVGYTWVKWSQFASGVFYNDLFTNIGLKTTVPTYDGSGSIVGLTIGMYTFQNYGGYLGTYPTCEVMVQTTYADKAPSYPGHTDNNGLYHIKIVIDEVSSFYEGYWGTTINGNTGSSAVSLRSSDDPYVFEASSGCVYNSQWGNLVPWTPVLMSATSVIIGAAGLILGLPFGLMWGSAWFFANTLKMMDHTGGDKHSQEWSDAEPAWADWYSCLGNGPLAVGKVNTSTTNTMDLAFLQQSGRYIFKVHADVWYAYSEMMNPRTGPYIGSIASASTPSVYWIVG